MQDICFEIEIPIIHELPLYYLKVYKYLFSGENSRLHCTVNIVIYESSPLSLT